MPGVVKIAFLADVGAAKVGLTQFAGTVDATVSKVGKSWDGLKDKLKLGALAGAAALGAGLAEGLDFGAAQSKLKAQLGLTGPEAEKIGKAAGDLYKGGFGESVEDAGDTIKEAFQKGIVGINDSRDAIREVGESIQNYVVLSGEDAAHTTTAVAQILKNKLAPNAKAAFDLLVRGQQLGINKSEDLLDTFNEYSVQFRQLGLDGPKALGLLHQGLQAGARDADTVADALKEFAIRAKDGSATTVDGFKLIGLNADKMQKIFAGGGPGAAAGLDLVLDRIRAIKDPSDRSTAAVDLFGTKSEDLQAALMALDPSTAVQGLGDLAGAAERAGDTLNDNAKARLTSFVRTVKTDVIEFLGTKAIPKLEEWGEAFTKKVKPKIDTLVNDALPKVKTAIENVTTFIDDNKQTFIDLADNAATLGKNLDTKLTPALTRIAPPLKSVAETDMTKTLASLQSLNVLLSGKTDTGEKAGILLKLESIVTVTKQFDLPGRLGTIAGDAIFKFGQRFVNDKTVRASVTGWIGRNFAGLTALLPLGQLATVGAVAANTIARAFGVQNPSGQVSTFMGKVAAAAIRVNPIGVWQTAGGALTKAMNRGILSGQPSSLGTVKGFAKAVGQGLIGGIPGASVVTAFLNLGTNAMGGLGRGVSAGVKGAVRVVAGIPGALARSGGDWGGALFNAGSRVISGLISGIRSKLPDLHGVLSGVTSIIPSWKGPLDKDKGLLKPAGAAIMGGLIDEIKAQLPDLKRTLATVSAGIESGLSASPTVDLSATAALTGGRGVLGAAAPVVVNVYAMTSGPEVGRQVVDTIRQYEQINGAGWRAA